MTLILNFVARDHIQPKNSASLRHYVDWGKYALKRNLNAAEDVTIHKLPPWHPAPALPRMR
jgi:hypothetical protein